MLLILTDLSMPLHMVGKLEVFFPQTFRACLFTVLKNKETIENTFGF